MSLQVDKAGKYVTSEVAKFMGGSCRSVISQLNIAHRALELFREDGVHLSEMGIEIFLANIKGMLGDVQEPE